MTVAAPLYCADTSALIAAWDERYPIDHFPPLWEEMEALIAAGRLIAPDEVRVELMKRSKDLAGWLDNAGNGEFFVQTDGLVLHQVTTILAAHERLVMATKRASAADPFVIGLARIRRAIVVTEETGGSESKPKIPFVCREYGVSCVSLLDLIRSENWVLGRR